MNIAFTAFDLPGEARSGVAYTVHYLGNELVQRGHKVVIFTTSPKPKDAKYEICQVKISSFLKKINGLKTILFPFLVLLKDFSAFDVLHSHGDNQYIFTKIPAIRTFYGSALDEALHATTIFRFLYQLFYVYPCEIISGLRSRKNVVISKNIKKRYPFITNVIYCGINLEIFKPGEKSKNPVILYVGGSIYGRKRGKMLLEIFRNKITKEMPKVELWLACKEKITGKGIKCFYQNLTTEQIAQLYQKAWILCLPSRYEGLGMPYIEALACGCAIVTTDNNGAREILDNGRYGYVAKEKDLSSAVLELIRNDKKRQHYEIIGVERAKNFLQHNALAKYIDIYKQLINS